jgi:hypothetical protein
VSESEAKTMEKKKKKYLLKETLRICVHNNLSLHYFMHMGRKYFRISLILFSPSHITIGIPSNQLHLLHNQVELSDSSMLKDIPNFQSGIKLKLVLGMKGGPISSSRRVPLTDYDSWFDDVLNQTSK